MAGTNFFTPISTTCWVALTDETVSSVNGQLAMFAKCLGAPPTTANVFAHGCLINRTDSGAGVAAVYQNTGTSASPVWTLLDTSLPGDTASSLIDTNSLTVVDVATVASQVNHITATPGAAGSGVTLGVTGTDTNVSTTVRGKGTGAVVLGQATSVGVTLAADQPILDSSSNELIKFVKATTAVNEVTIANAATGGTPSISATGGDANIPLILQAKGVSVPVVVNLTDDGANGSSLALVHQTASPANDDVVGLIGFTEGTSIATLKEYATITAKTVNVTALSEEGILEFEVAGAGSGVPAFALSAANVITKLPVLDQSIETRTGSGALSILKSISVLNTTGGGAITLAAGTEGLRKTVVMLTDGGDGTVTVTNPAWGGAGTIVFSAVGQSVEMLYTNSKWFVLGSNPNTPPVVS